MPTTAMKLGQYNFVTNCLSYVGEGNIEIAMANISVLHKFVFLNVSANKNAIKSFIQQRPAHSYFAWDFINYSCILTEGITCEMSPWQVTNPKDKRIQNNTQSPATHTKGAECHSSKADKCGKETCNVVSVQQCKRQARLIMKHALHKDEVT